MECLAENPSRASAKPRAATGRHRQLLELELFDESDILEKGHGPPADLGQDQKGYRLENAEPSPMF